MGGAAGLGFEPQFPPRRLFSATRGRTIQIVVDFPSAVPSGEIRIHFVSPRIVHVRFRAAYRWRTSVPVLSRSYTRRAFARTVESSGTSILRFSGVSTARRGCTSAPPAPNRARRGLCGLQRARTAVFDVTRTVPCAWHESGLRGWCPSLLPVGEPRQAYRLRDRTVSRNRPYERGPSQSVGGQPWSSTEVAGADRSRWR